VAFMGNSGVTSSVTSFSETLVSTFVDLDNKLTNIEVVINDPDLEQFIQGQVRGF
jgi:hypothetical protein